MRKMITCAILAALYVVLSLFAKIDLGPVRLSLSGLPVILAGIAMGPLYGLVTGLIGSLAEQLMKYGLTVTTPVWLLAEMARGCVTGLISGKLFGGISLRKSAARLTGIILLSSVVVTACNTLAMVLDAHVLGTYQKGVILSGVLLRLLSGCACAVVFSCVTWPILSALHASGVLKAGSSGRKS